MFKRGGGLARAGERRTISLPVIPSTADHQVEIELMALEITTMRVIAMELANRKPGPEASILKVQGTEIQQTLTELMMLALGPRALPYQPAALDAGYAGPLSGPDYAVPLTGRYHNHRKASI